jgi:imidazolonepropionase-like amidohydrolase
MRVPFFVIVTGLILTAKTMYAQPVSEEKILLQNVKIFNGISPTLSGPVNVLIQNGTIQVISLGQITISKDTKVINGEGKTLMPGLIDVHVHMFFGALTMQEMMSPEFSDSVAFAKVSLSAEQMLLRGFTSVRDAGGPIFPLKAAIDIGKINGPRIWPSGAVISQTAGHGDFRTPSEKSRRFFGQPSRAELSGATFIADGRDEVLTAVRENLRMGASQIKVMAGGGTSSAYDPVDVTQYTLDEMRAAVQAADDWGTYVMVHAYTPKAIRRAIDAGVKCIEHGQLLDEKTMELIAQKKIWLSSQNLEEDSPDMDPLRIEKRKSVIEGQAKIWPMAKRHKVKLAWGTDFLFNPSLNDQQNAYILRLQKWFTNPEILKMITHDNAELLQLSGLRTPYPGKLGVIREGAFADLLLINGNPLKDLSLIADPKKNILVIIKAGKIYKNIL